ncbi:L-tryptophan--pyruvate aminotransferase 1 [Tanacetum coccineum]
MILNDSRILDDETYVELVTSPNNPNGVIRGAVVNHEGGILVHDLAYYWPQYTPVTSSLDSDIMLFTASKCTGHAGSRIGWALVKDKEVAKKMTKYMEVTTIGVSKESQLRVAKILQVVADGCKCFGYPDGDNFFEFGQKMMAKRWEILRETVKKKPIVPLPKFLSALHLLWTCHSSISRGGSRFGSDPSFVRVSMMSKDEEFNLFIDRLSMIQSFNDGNGNEIFYETRNGNGNGNLRGRLGKLSVQSIWEWLAYHVKMCGEKSHLVIHDAGGVHPEVMEVLMSWVVTHVSDTVLERDNDEGRCSAIKWKMKTLSIVPKKVLQILENIRCHFFHGIENNERKPIWVNGVWRFRTQNASLREKFIKGIHGNDGKLGSIATHHHPSIWLDIVREVESLKHQGIDLSGFIRKKMGKGNDTLFWEDVWKGEVAFKLVYPRIYALDSCKNDTVAVKLSRNSMDHSFRRAPREGIGHTQFNALLTDIDGINLADMMDRWVWTLEGSGEFSVASIRRLIDKRILPEVSTKTRWITGSID